MKNLTTLPYLFLLIAVTTKTIDITFTFLYSNFPNVTLLISRVIGFTLAWFGNCNNNCTDNIYP
ncbi:hypothetical protein GCM10007140_13540 [Priestia taiwanensis]|uniref:Uncharacterized protein n=1 Tax=Priestia taiwanensis TaxID=1347902 RepID=A0A917APJ0_9BACI|nr:hypothetical protein GCM10007140_13540 [Priestia taiwanensis]